MCKRLLDIFAATIGLLILFPLFLLIGFFIKLADRGPIFYRQLRVGINGKLFRLWKFRSMIMDADKKGPLLTQAEDKRITPIGSYLRKYKIDELPQLINVLSGDMSLVGPRPNVTYETDKFTESEQKILTVKPGITDISSLIFSNEEELLRKHADPYDHYYKVIWPIKRELILLYVNKQSIWLDIYLIILTVMNIFYPIWTKGRLQRLLVKLNFSDISRLNNFNDNGK